MRRDSRSKQRGKKRVGRGVKSKATTSVECQTKIGRKYDEDVEAVSDSQYRIFIKHVIVLTQIKYSFFLFLQYTKLGCPE